MFTVYGTHKGVLYGLGVHDEDLDESHGCVMGSSHVVSALHLAEGDPVRAYPTSAVLTLDLKDPESILAFLRERTNVISVAGVTPEPLPMRDVVY